MDVPRELERARRYFHLCAATGHADCQVRLAKLLLGLPHREEREYVQAVAWLQLAADQGNSEARDLVGKETAQLTPEQISWAKRLKTQLVHRHKAVTWRRIFE